MRGRDLEPREQKEENKRRQRGAKRGGREGERKLVMDVMDPSFVVHLGK